MKALILAAGLGSRLVPLTDERPKSLIPVNGQPILMKQLANLHECGITDITIVSGYKADILKQTVHARYPDIHIIKSAEYATTNNMYSAYLAKDAMGADGFCMMNADVFFDASVIAALLRFPAENAIVVDIGTYLEESMKVTEEARRLTQISKTITPEAALGASIDIYKFSPEGAAAFFAKCEAYIVRRNERALWSEVALNDILQDVVFQACPLEGRWLEIDNLDDLSAAERLFV